MNTAKENREKKIIYIPRNIDSYLFDFQRSGPGRNLANFCTLLRSHMDWPKTGQTRKTVFDLMCSRKFVYSHNLRSNEPRVCDRDIYKQIPTKLNYIIVVL